MLAQNDRSSLQVLELLEMPLDILFEICQHLYPLDILSLGRTSRVTRQLVRSPAFKPVWVHARYQHHRHLPDCPGGMTEPAYAELIFGDSCLACGTLCALDQMRYIFEARDRLCVDCFLSRYSYSEDCKLSCLPAEVTKLLPTYFHTRGDGCVRIRTAFYSNAHLSSWLIQYESAENQRQWEDTMIHQQENVKKHAQLCSSFNVRWKEEVIYGRIKVLFAHMEKLGYGDEMKRSEKVMHELAWDFRQLCQKPLTLEGKALLPNDLVVSELMAALGDMASEIESAMQLVKSKHIEKELEEAYCTRLQTLKRAYDEALLFYPPDEPYLRISDVLSIPRIWSIVSETPLEVHVAKELFNISAETLADMTAETTSAIHARLISLAEVGLSDKSFDPATILASATTVFRSRRARPTRRIFFFVPEALSEHNVSWDSHGSVMKKNALLYNTARKIFRSYLWGFDDSVNFDRRSHDLLCDILAICGLDPTTTLLSDLEEESPIVECTECSTVDSGRLLMSWSWAAYHTSNSHPDSSLVTSQRFQHVVGNESVEARVAFKEAVIERYISLNQVVRTRCAYCNHAANMMPEMATHLHENHDIPSIRPTDIKYAYDPTQRFVRTRYMQEYRIPPSSVAQTW